LGSLADLPRVPLDGRSITASPDLLGPHKLGLALLNVLGNVNEDGAGPAGLGEVKRLADNAGKVLRVLDEGVVLGDRQGGAGRVDLLERVFSDQRRGHLAGYRDDRYRVQERVGDAGNHVGRAGTRRGEAHTDLAGRTGVSVGREDGPLLVSHEDVLKGILR